MVKKTKVKQHLRKLTNKKSIKQLIRKNSKLTHKKLNVATTSLQTARKYSDARLKNELGYDLNYFLPNFDINYVSLQRSCNYALDIPRYRMPVIEPKDMKLFEEKIKSGHIDIFKPYASADLFPENLKGKRGEKWLTLGLKDGKIRDDVLKVKIIRIPAKKLFPLQSQIWLNLLIDFIIQYGVPKKGSRVLDTTIIVSKEYYILDGHHRYGQVMLANPNLKIKTLLVPLKIGILLKMGRSYGQSIGNTPNY